MCRTLFPLTLAYQVHPPSRIPLDSFDIQTPVFNYLRYFRGTSESAEVSTSHKRSLNYVVRGSLEIKWRSNFGSPTHVVSFAKLHWLTQARGVATLLGHHTLTDTTRQRNCDSLLGGYRLTTELLETCIHPLGKMRLNAEMLSLVHLLNRLVVSRTPILFHPRGSFSTSHSLRSSTKLHIRAHELLPYP